jgi:tRNA(Ile)-lysidine synthase
LRAASPAQPIGAAEFAALLQPLAAHRRFLVAVSGGPDSTALMHALARWAPEAGCSVLAATIDHGLRPGSRAEAEAVAADASALGLEHRILTWSGPKPGARLQERAREARYGLLTGLARQEAAAVATAHTLDDQAETVLLRLAAGSGIAGLAGIPAHTWVEGVSGGRSSSSRRPASSRPAARKAGVSSRTPRTATPASPEAGCGGPGRSSPQRA